MSGTTKSKGMCIGTRCTSVEQFIELFHRYVDEDSFFVATTNTRPPGLKTSFSVNLADGTPVLRGLCTVLQVWTSTTSPFKTPGVRLGIQRLTASSMPIFERLLVTRSKPGHPSAPLARQFSESAPTTVQPAPKLTGGDEQRTPGSSYILPANPLMNLTDESLEGYVDCTLYEETANFFPIEDESEPTEDDDVVEPPVFAPRPVVLATPPDSSEPELPPVTVDVSGTIDTDVRPAPPLPVPTPAPPRVVVKPPTPTPPRVLVIPPTSSPAGAADDGAPRSAARTTPPAPIPAIEPARVARATPPAPMPVVEAAIPAPAEPAPAPIATGPAPVASTVPPIDSPPAPEVEPLFRLAPRESSASGEVQAVPAPVTSSRKRWTLGAAGAALVVATTISIIALGGTSGDERTKADRPVTPAAKPAVEPVPAIASAPPPAVAPAPAPEQPKPDDADEQTGAADDSARDPDSGSPLVGDGPCRIVVSSTPAGSLVYLDGDRMAPSPVTLATTCAKHAVEIKHPRYAAAAKTVSPTEASPSTVDLALRRPTHSVSFTSKPTGATVFIDGKRAGTTPTVVSVMGFTNLKIELKKTGFAPVSTRLYSKSAQDTFAAKMTKW